MSLSHLVSEMGSLRLLDVFNALVVDEDDDGVDVHAVQPLDGVGAVSPQKETVDVTTVVTSKWPFLRVWSLSPYVLILPHIIFAF